MRLQQDVIMISLVGDTHKNCNNCPLVSKTRNGQRYISEMYSKKKQHLKVTYRLLDAVDG